MDLADYFANKQGTGVLATSDSAGNVDVAIYARPYVIGEDTVAFSMTERLSYANVQSNPKAAYLFMERGEGYAGKRLYLTRTGEEKDPQRIEEAKKQHSRTYNPEDTHKHFVYFTVDKVRPLVGDDT
ncbi:MAG: pyridoxamine 5'-phosphate oxidase family protein [Phycisphaerales bacterium]|nr:MAG: pyridoxamine 5'-phosphate oxidase family protein [Phycisphaerales bacterium]